MRIQTLSRSAPVEVRDYRCEATPGERPFVECFADHSLSFVRAGSFGCRARGQARELVAGGFLVGAPGEEYTCTHDHHAGGDACLAFHFSAGFIDGLACRPWPVGGLPPITALATLAEAALARWRRDDGIDPGFDEIGVALAARYVALVEDRPVRHARPSPADRRRAVAGALWIEANATEAIDLDAASRTCGLTPWHFLRVFRDVIGVTPHQHLVRARLRRAAARLAEGDSVTGAAAAAGFGDLSNFVRTFGRTTGLTPRAFQRAVRGHRALRRTRLHVLR
jgi:AraC family transcriptional regulator